MKKEDLIKLKVVVEITVPFHKYEYEGYNKSAKKKIVKYLLDGIKNEFEFIPIYVEPDGNKGFIEDCSDKIKIKILEM